MTLAWHASVQGWWLGGTRVAVRRLSKSGLKKPRSVDELDMAWGGGLGARELPFGGSLNQG